MKKETCINCKYIRGVKEVECFPELKQARKHQYGYCKKHKTTVYDYQLYNGKCSDFEEVLWQRLNG